MGRYSYWNSHYDRTCGDRGDYRGLSPSGFYSDSDGDYDSEEVDDLCEEYEQNEQFCAEQNEQGCADVATSAASVSEDIAASTTSAASRGVKRAREDPTEDQPVADAVAAKKPNRKQTEEYK